VDPAILEMKVIELTEHQEDGMSAFVIEKGAAGLTVGRDIDKMGHKTEYVP
jgi:alkylation response protein AidB-like acyl-CoA dehydrogenase